MGGLDLLHRETQICRGLAQSELRNSFGKPGYGGPQQPPGSGDHPYVATLYALNVRKLDVKPDTSLAGFEKALEGKVLGTAKTTGYYGR